MNDTPLVPYDYQSEGGALLMDAPTYVKRKADDELYEGLKAGQFCYVLNARQMGKSSLKVRTLQRLRGEGIACAAVDLQGIGTSATEEQWYFGIISRIARSLGLHRQFDLNTWWTEQPRLSYVQRFVEFLESLVLPSVPQPIVIFIDEVDLTLSLPFRDDFFGALRESYNRRADEPEYRRLTFALFGVATPSDLIQNKQITPFNIGRPVDLTGFQWSEAQPLMLGLVAKTSHPEVLLQAILDWTGGQPFLTQKLCKLAQVADSEPLAGRESQWVEQLVQTKVIDNWETQDIPPHLKTIRDRLLLSGEQRTGRLLGLYQQILQQGKIAADDSPEQVELRLTGLVVKRDGKLRVYNRIYEQVFDRNWLERSLAELRPYGGAIAAWLVSGCQDESRLLRGQALQDARTWAEGKSLGDDDRRFLDASQELEKRDVQARLATEQEANQILTAATRKANRRNLFSLVGAVVALVVAGVTIPTSIKAGADRDIALQEVKEARQDKDRLETDKMQLVADKDRLETDKTQLMADKVKLDANLQATLTQAATAETEAQEAERKYQQARTKEQSARQQYQQAKQQVQQAKRQLEQVNQGKAQAEQAELAALVQVKTAQAQLATTQGNLNQAKVELNQAQDSQATILQVNSLEKDGVAALNRTKFEQLRGLVDAMRVGERARNLFHTKGQAGFAASPIYALQTTLDRVKNRAIQPWQHQTLLAHRSTIREAQFSPDGKRIVTASDDKTAWVWDAQSGQEIAKLAGHESGIFRAQFSPDGKRIVTASKDKTARVWDAQSGQEIAKLAGHEAYVYAAQFSPDGKRIVTASDDKTARVWDAQSGQEIAKLAGHESGIFRAQFSPDGKRIVAVSSDKTARVWDAQSGQEIAKLAGHEAYVYAAQFSPDGKRIVTASEDK
ncbi:AAA-like domain-containing protein, partial [Trichocoleus desertorum AS-A10]|uniref:AAA-like domain-containing protein n=1 Tax=Trichocoleus desertorum TaxID=1481672 RepID=UPI00329778A0